MIKLYIALAAVFLAFVIVAFAYGASPASFAPEVNVEEITNHSVKLGLKCGTTYKIEVRQRVNNSWSGPTTRTPTTLACVLPPPPTQYTLTITKAGTGAGTISNSPAGSTYNAGTAVTLTASAASGSTFTGYSGACVSSTITCTLTVNSNSTVTATFTADTQPPAGGTRYDVTEPSSAASFPRDLTTCLANIVRSPYNPNGNSPYNVPRDDLGTGWKGADPKFNWWETGYSNWTNPTGTGRRDKVDDHYVFANGSAPTSDEIFSVGACRWGIREDLLRAVSVQESDWHEHGAPGDQCSGHTSPTDDYGHGYGSFGIMQQKHYNCASNGDWGGFPRSWYSAPFAVDFYGAAFRACLEQSFWYTVPAADSMATRERGCVGAWFSGSYNPSISYTNSVYNHLANRDWTRY